MNNSFPSAQEGHFQMMFRYPNRKQMFISLNDGEMQPVSYLYKVLSLPDHQQVLFVKHGRFSSSIVSFNVSQLREYRQKQRNHGKDN